MVGPQKRSLPRHAMPHYILIRISTLLGNANHASIRSPPLLSPCLPDPVTQREAPVARNERTTENVDDLDQKDDEAVARFLDLQQNGFDVVLEEDTRDDALADFVALLGHGVLVREKRGIVSRVGGPDAVDGGHDRHEVLELVEICGGDVDCSVKRIFEGRVEATKGELVDDVGKVEV